MQKSAAYWEGYFAVLEKVALNRFSKERALGNLKPEYPGQLQEIADTIKYDAKFPGSKLQSDAVDAAGGMSLWRETAALDKKYDAAVKEFGLPPRANRRAPLTEKEMFRKGHPSWQRLRERLQSSPDKSSGRISRQLGVSPLWAQYGRPGPESSRGAPSKWGMHLRREKALVRGAKNRELIKSLLKKLF